MTVSELVELLKQYDPDSRVMIQGIDYEMAGLTIPKIRGYDPEQSPTGETHEGFVLIE